MMAHAHDLLLLINKQRNFAALLCHLSSLLRLTGKVKQEPAEKEANFPAGSEHQFQRLGGD